MIKRGRESNFIIIKYQRLTTSCRTTESFSEVELAPEWSSAPALLLPCILEHEVLVHLSELKWSLNLLWFCVTVHAVSIPINTQENSLKISAWMCLLKKFVIQLLLFVSVSFPFQKLQPAPAAPSYPGGKALHSMELTSLGHRVHHRMQLVTSPRVKTISVHPKVSTGTVKKMCHITK